MSLIMDLDLKRAFVAHYFPPTIKHDVMVSLF